MIDTSGRFPKQNQISAITKPIRVRLSGLVILQRVMAAKLETELQLIVRLVTI